MFQVGPLPYAWWVLIASECQQSSMNTKASVKAFEVLRSDFAQTSWTAYVRERVPARVARTIQFVSIDKRQEPLYAVVWWYGRPTPIRLPYSELFPTELDIARLCVECP